MRSADSYQSIKDSDELKKEANEYAKEIEKKYVFMDYGQASALGYLAGAEPREKQIQIDAEHIIALQKQNGELTDKVSDLEIRCNELFLQTCEQAEKIKELEAQIEKMKRCFNCKYRNKFVESKCGECEGYSKWEIQEND